MNIRTLRRTMLQRGLLPIVSLILFVLAPLEPSYSAMREVAALAADVPDRAGARSTGRLPEAQVAIEPYVRPDLAVRMERLRPRILAAAARHNHQALSGMSDRRFAAVIALIIYNENFGWLEDDIAPLRVFTPLYQDLQRRANSVPLGGNFSVWPANLRPSVAIEILEQRVPLPDGMWAEVALEVAGSTIDPREYPNPEALSAAVTAEISRDDLAVAYLAANLERGLYRAKYEGVPVTWRTLAAWHNQGVVDPAAIRANPTSRDYVRRAAAYLPLAEALVAPSPSQLPYLIAQ